MKCFRLYICFAACFFLLGSVYGQYRFFEPADSLDQRRFWLCASGGAALYGTASYGLYQLWYKDYEGSKFHTFNDNGQWLNMDKAGHTLAAYTQAELSFYGLRWTGMPHRKSIWIAAGVGTLLQGTIELMDAHSAKWGFSWYDIGYNTLGVGLFAGQELLWQEQRIRFKLSHSPVSYADYLVPASGEGPGYPLRNRAKELYGQNYVEAFLKDYNGHIVWASANVNCFLGDRAPGWLPPWLNVAVGYSGENMFGGYGNSWTSAEGYDYALNQELFPRYRQAYLSLDIDLRRIPTEKKWLRTVFSMLNWVKIPAPALEFNQGQGVRFHPLIW